MSPTAVKSQRNALILAAKAAHPELNGKQIAALTGFSRTQVYAALNPEGEQRRRAEQIARHKAPNPYGHQVTGPKARP